MTRQKKQQAIGVFDSGMGGLTVLNQLIQQLPKESFIYLGDTARLPYGTKSEEAVRRYAEQMARILYQYQIKLLVVACNTATAAALPYLESLFPSLPIIGVIEPGALAAISATNNHNIAVLATESTILSGVYQKTIQYYQQTSRVVSQACGLFVALAEEGMVSDNLAELVVKKYLTPIVEHEVPVDCILLGCTHFPVFESLIRRFVGDSIVVVNSAKTTAQAVFTTLKELNLLNDAEHVTMKFLVTDLPGRFIRIGEIFLQQAIEPSSVLLVDVNSDYPTAKFASCYDY